MKLLYILLAFLIGVLVPFQAIVNSRLASYIQSNITATFISFSGGFLIFLAIVTLSPTPFPTWSKLTSLPPYMFLGGLIGCVFVLSATILVPKLGSTGFVGLVVAGQLCISLVVDHFGILGLPVNSLSAIRVVGALLLAGGATIILKY